MYDRCQISRTARLTLGRMTRDEWLVAMRMIDSICADPGVDNIRKFVMYRPPVVIRFFQDPPFKIYYHLASPTVVYILSIRPADPVPPLDEWDDWLKGR